MDLNYEHQHYSDGVGVHTKEVTYPQAEKVMDELISVVSLMPSSPIIWQRKHKEVLSQYTPKEYGRYPGQIYLKKAYYILANGAHIRHMVAMIPVASSPTLRIISRVDAFGPKSKDLVARIYENLNANKDKTLIDT